MNSELKGAASHYQRHLAETFQVTADREVKPYDSQVHA